jgi:hypothetical protein
MKNIYLILIIYYICRLYFYVIYKFVKNSLMFYYLINIYTIQYIQ